MSTSQGWDGIVENPIPGDVVKCLNELGVEVIRVIDEEVQAKCPAHLRRTGKEDRNPSWSVNTDTGQHNCFSCGFRGPFIVIVKEMAGLNDEDATAWIKERGSIDRAVRMLFGSQTVEDQPEEDPITEADLALYVEPPEWACGDRGLTPRAVDHYGILWDAKKEHWITPIRDPWSGRLWGWQEKGHDTRFFRNRPKEVKKARTWFGFQQQSGDTAVIVESPLDTTVIHAAGIEDQAVAGYGVWISDFQLDLLSEAGIRNIISALDNDRDGNKANGELRERCRGRFRLKFWNYGDTDAKDPGDQTPREIRQSYETAYSSVLWRP